MKSVFTLVPNSKPAVSCSALLSTIIEKRSTNCRYTVCAWQLDSCQLAARCAYREHKCSNALFDWYFGQSQLNKKSKWRLCVMSFVESRNCYLKIKLLDMHVRLWVRPRVKTKYKSLKSHGNALVKIGWQHKDTHVFSFTNWITRWLKQALADQHELVTFCFISTFFVCPHFSCSWD